MRWSWKIGEVAGIGLYIHATFWLLIAFVLLLNWSDGHSLAAALYGAVFVLVIFGCITLHELGHALTAHHYGVRTRDITLLPIGGLARLERMPDDPIQELWVALAGPAVNVAIAVLLYAAVLLSGGTFQARDFISLSGTFLANLLVVNLWLVAFNMIPAFPMDGGRVLRALLATRVDMGRATQISARVGQGIAFTLGVGCLFGLAGIFSLAGFFRLDGLFSDPFLILIAVFVWTGAKQEADASRMHASISSIPVQHVMLHDFHTLRPDDTLGEAVNHVLAGWREDFPVVFGDHVLGMLTREDMTQGLAQGGSETRVRDSMRRDIAAIDPRLRLEQALVMIRELNCRSLPVVQEGRLVGLFTLDNVGSFLSIHSALRQADRKTRDRREKNAEGESSKRAI
ncbi:MAG TPA: site-2 protease family protein [Terriglobia bacterium]|nr:site-2 protease family protein [Terriglobia bacterium]